MNTIIQKRIEEKSRHYLLYEHESPLNKILHRCYLKTETQYHIDIKNAYVAGATFALQNQWISVDEALPEFEGNFSDYYIVRAESGLCAVTMYYRTSEKEYWWNFEKVKVTHWMPIPQLKEVKNDNET